MPSSAGKKNVSPVVRLGAIEKDRRLHVGDGEHDVSPVLRLGAIAKYFFFNDTATTEIYTLSLHDALPIFPARARRLAVPRQVQRDHGEAAAHQRPGEDRKSTRLNSSHLVISYAVFCLKKKKNKQTQKTKIKTTKIKNT